MTCGVLWRNTSRFGLYDGPVLNTPAVLELGAFFLMLNWARRNGWKGWRLPEGMKLPNLEAYGRLDAQAMMRAFELGLKDAKGRALQGFLRRALSEEWVRVWMALASFLSGEQPESEIENSGLPSATEDKFAVSARQREFLRKQSRGHAVLGVRSCVAWARFIS